MTHSILHYHRDCYACLNPNAIPFRQVRLSELRREDGGIIDLREMCDRAGETVRKSKNL
jgi:hypothetical protein